jgi:MbtH protein
MSDTEAEDTRPYLVLVNDEEQYSFWLKSKEIPRGWRAVKEGSKSECADYVREVWTDMRPLSLRRQMDGAATQGQTIQ